MTCIDIVSAPHARRVFPLRVMTLFSAGSAATFLASAAAPTPLYLHYQAAFRLSPGMLTLIFAAYALCLLFALLTVGSLSDYVGRRPVIFAASLLNVVAMLIFANADSALSLTVARMLQGFGTGMATTALGAAILDTDRRRGPFLNSLTAFVGLFLGALGSGLLVNFAPTPTKLIYFILLALSAAEALLLIWMPETVTRRSGVLRSLLPVVRLPKAIRRRFFQIAPANIAAWALGGLNFSLMPALVRLTTGQSSTLTGSIVVATLMAGAVLAVALLRPIAPQRTLLLGALGLVSGTALILTAIAAAMVPLMFVGILLAGSGFGASFSGAFRELLPKAEAGDRAGLLSTIYIESYLAFSIPVIAAGLAIPHLGLARTAYVYGGAIMALAFISAVLTLAQSRPQASQHVAH